ncbi:hypothetical protein [Antarctobacter sp.]|uniref:hypothetical protein n=1 Tax=Antarctobacter sp. TaxID=1872577 RepID=UPI002B26561B|nr:hypothetical protein [Antarctobacter sp.]
MIRPADATLTPLGPVLWVSVRFSADVVPLVYRVDRPGPGIEIARRSRRIAVASVAAVILYALST